MATLSKEEMWKTVLGEMELSLSRAHFTTWFRNTLIVAQDRNTVTVSVPNGFVKEWLENKFNKQILLSIRKLSSDVREMKYIVGQPKNEVKLFLYGNVGLGKTHIIQSVGNSVLQNNPDARILYMPAERLTVSIVDALQNQTIEGLKKLYCDLDLFIIDDVQYIAGKTKTQEIFFTIFNELYNRNKQVVLTSDRPPKAIASLEERLQSRFEGGVVADIGLPDYETRLAILKRKLVDRSIEFDDEILEYVASNIQKNVRELEGALNRVLAFAQIYNRIPDLKEVKNILQVYQSVPHRKTSPQSILKTVAAFYNISTADLTKRSRKKEVVRPRQIAMYLLRHEVSLSFPEIGQKLGGRDHSTVIHACDKIKKEEA
jgi:chromosomal replication initiator protein